MFQHNSINKCSCLKTCSIWDLKTPDWRIMRLAPHLLMWHHGNPQKMTPAALNTNIVVTWKEKTLQPRTPPMSATHLIFKARHPSTPPLTKTCSLIRPLRTISNQLMRQPPNWATMCLRITIPWRTVRILFKIPRNVIQTLQLSTWTTLVRLWKQLRPSSKRNPQLQRARLLICRSPRSKKTPTKSSTLSMSMVQIEEMRHVIRKTCWMYTSNATNL